MLDSIEVRALALDLEDATEDMNDAIRASEEAFRVHAPPMGSVVLRDDDKERLVWNGESLVYVCGSKVKPVLHGSRATRVAACHAIPKLWETLTGRKYEPI